MWRCCFSVIAKAVVITGRQSGHHPGRKLTAVHVRQGDRGLRDAESQGKTWDVHVAHALFILK